MTAYLKGHEGSPIDEIRTEWQQWHDQLWESMTERFGYPGLAHLEQLMIRSRREKRCVDCGAAGTSRQTGGGLVKSVDHYYFCDDCAAYWDDVKEQAR